MFASAMSGSPGQAPSSADAQTPLLRMVEMIKAGQIGAMIPFDPQGTTVHLG
jgi:hypothetical protein